MKESTLDVGGTVEKRALFEKNGVLCREGTYDEYVVKEIQRSYGMLDVKDKVVFDIGANIGAFTLWALEQGAREVHSYEPEPHNFKMLKLNTQRERRRQNSRVRILEAAVLNECFPGQQIDLFIAPSGKNPGNSSVVPKRGRHSIKIDAVSFYEECLEYAPEVIKMDVEGAEYDILTEGIPDCVKQVAMEIHLNSNENYAQASEFVEMFKDWGCLRTPVLNNPKLWQTLGTWYRT